MLAARRASEAEGLTIDWRQGDARELPFAGASFDLVVCQHELQFFPNRVGALAEMHRVLAPGGQVAVATWRGLDQHLVFAAYARTVWRRFYSPVLAMPFSLGDPAAVVTLLHDAGFRELSVEPMEIEADYAKSERFIGCQMKASAAAISSLQVLSPTELETLIAAMRVDLAALMQTATAADRLRFVM